MRRHFLIAAALCGLIWACGAQADTFSFTGGVVSYVAPSGETNHVFLIHEEKPVRGFRSIDTGAAVTAGPGCSSVGPNEAFCPTLDFPDQVLVSVDNQNDYVNTSAGTIAETRLEGGAGNDALHSGQDLGAELDGGPGADTMSGEGAVVDYSSRTNPLVVTMGDGLTNDGEAGENDLIADDVSAVIGGSGADTFTLTGSNNAADAGLGADHLMAIGCVFCGLRGGQGNDHVEADQCHCGLVGGTGNDTLVGGDGGQFLTGGEGDDVIRAEGPAVTTSPATVARTR
jgi:Ca2+-binding RTX toxin-like protein